MNTSDYFSNHHRARRFPWSLYHAPIERDLLRFLQTVANEHPAGHVLIIGCGLLHEIDMAPAGLQFTIVDTDERAVAAVLARRDQRIIAAHVVPAETPLNQSLATVIGTDAFVAAYAKEVIEHVVAWPLWLVGLRRILVPRGRLWLSTPNYGEPWLPLLESTALELVARADGFSRRHLHPSRFSASTLASALRAAGFGDVSIHHPLPRLALTAHARTTSLYVDQ